MSGTPESRDPVTGAALVRLTDAAVYQHHLHQSGPTLTPDGAWLVWVSWETGSPNLCARLVAGGEVRRLTYRKDLAPLSPVATRDGLAVLYTARDTLVAATIEEGEETELAAFPGALTGDPAAAPDGRTVIVPVATGSRHRIVEVDLFTKAQRVLLDEPSRGPAGRVQVSPDGGRLLLEGAPGEMPRVLARTDRAVPADLLPETEGEWLAHPVWLSADRVAVVRWRDGLYVADLERNATCVFKGPIWHAAPNPAGTLLACDTHAPDLGVLLVAPATGRWKVLCHPRSSNRGTQWFEPLPADAPADSSLNARPGAPPDNAESRYGPVWSHPRPSFSPDGRSVIFTTDSSGWPNVYAATIPNGWTDELTRA